MFVSRIFSDGSNSIALQRQIFANSNVGDCVSRALPLCLKQNVTQIIINERYYTFPSYVRTNFVALLSYPLLGFTPILKKHKKL